MVETWAFYSKMSPVKMGDEKPGPALREPPGSGHIGNNPLAQRGVYRVREKGHPYVKCPPLIHPLKIVWMSPSMTESPTLILGADLG